MRAAAAPPNASPPPAPSSVDPNKAAAAQALFDQAVDEMKAKSFSSACPKLEEATRLVPDALGAKVELAQCYEGWDKKASAWSEWNQVAGMASAQNQVERAKTATERIDALRPSLSLLTIRVSSEVSAIADLKVTRDNVEVGRAAWSNPLPVDEGMHEIVVSAPGYVEWRAVASVPSDGVKLSIEVRSLTRAMGPARPQEGHTSRTWQGPLGIAAMAVGGGALVAGGIFGGLALSKKGESNKTECNAVTNACSAAGISLRKQALTFASASTGLFVAGAVVAGAGIVVFATAPHGHASNNTAQVSLRPLGVSVEGSFE